MFLSFILNPKNIPWLICGALFFIIIVLTGEILLLKLDIKDEHADAIYYRSLAESEQGKRMTIEKNRDAVLVYVKRLEQIKKKMEKAKAQIQQSPTVGGQVNDAEPVASDLISIHNDVVDFFNGMPAESGAKPAGAGRMPEGGTGPTSEGGAK
ncbi:MAG: hypothetical protein PHU53_07040 [Thermoplasmata archaeon]|nr:hypothetical protein [Thermoplasmata archaeon]